MTDWQYSSSVQELTLTAGNEANELGDLDEFVHSALELSAVAGTEVVSHSLSMLGDERYLLTMIFRWPTTLN